MSNFGTNPKQNLTYRVFHLRMSFLKVLKMSENQYVDKKIRQHSLQHLKTEVRNLAFFGDLSTATTKYLRLWRPAFAFKIHSKACKSNDEAL